MNRSTARKQKPQPPSDSPRSAARPKQKPAGARRSTQKPGAAASHEQVARKRWFGAADETRRNAVIGAQFAQVRERVLWHLKRNGVPMADADDVCADVFVIALRKLPSYSGRSALSTWILGIAHKLAAGYRGSARVRYEQTVAEVPEHGTDAGPQLALEHKLEGLRVRDAVASLKATQAEVVGRFMLDEAPMEAVARKARVPLQTAYARLYAGQAALRATLADVG